jgi:hypothetical protein
MPLEAPNLDDRRFEDIVQEARALIPRYLPKWTDWNPSDPGITLIQLFAWMSEMLLYRLNQVPEHHYIKFLQLLGIQRKPAWPAHAELTFTLTSPDLSSVTVPKGTRVAASAGEGDPVIFETDEALTALGAAIKEVQTFDGTTFTLQTQANTVIGQQYLAFGPHATEGSALCLGFAFSEAFPTEEINLAIYVSNPVEPNAHTCDFEEGQIVLPAQVTWEYLAGEAQWSPLHVTRDETRAFTRSGHVYFRGPSTFTELQLGAVENPLYWIRARVVQAGYEVPPEMDEVLTNTVRATAAATVQDEVLGSSNGRPEQTFSARNKPIFAEVPRMEQIRERKRRRPERPSPQEVLAEQEHIREAERRKGFLLEVEEEAGFQAWEEVEDFFESGPDDRHYLLDRATSEVCFGDGKRGKIPLAGVSNIVARYYRHGGGARGNVGADTITALQTSFPYVASVTNKRAAEGGKDEEPMEDTKQRGPREIKARDRAVTPEDFEFLAVQTPGARIRRAHALPLHHPQFPGVEVPGVVTVVVIPDSQDPMPMPSEGTLRTVCAHLNQHRLLTSEVYVVPPKYKEITIDGRVSVRLEADLAQVRRQIDKRLLSYLHPLKGGIDGQGWEAGDNVPYLEVFRVIMEVEGVHRIEELRIVVDGKRLDITEDADIPDGYLIFSQKHDLDVEYRRGN